jgi:hypothetical protein
MSPYASVIPGRIRLRHGLLRAAGRHQALCAALQDALRGRALVEGEVAQGSLLITAAPGQEAEAEALVRQVVAAQLPELAENRAIVPTRPAITPRSQGGSAVRRRPVKRQVNQWAKVGAVASMAVSLAALGTSRRLHAQAGVVFVGMMLTHMAVHWRRTFK